MKIGVMVESFRKSFREGVEEAAALGADGIQVYATRGELGVDEITKDKLREALDIVESHGMVFSAVCGDFYVGFTDPEKNKIYVKAHCANGLQGNAPNSKRNTQKSEKTKICSFL